MAEPAPSKPAVAGVDKLAVAHETDIERRAAGVAHDGVAPEILDALRKYDTPTVCNVIELFEVRPRNTGYTDDRISASYPALPPMVGFATTATFRAGAPPKGGDTYIGLGAQIEKIAAMGGPKVVVFQDLDDPPVAATFTASAVPL